MMEEILKKKPEAGHLRVTSAMSDFSENEAVWFYAKSAMEELIEKLLKLAASV